MREIHLPGGKVAKISDEDWPLASQYSWSDNGKGYPRARARKSAGGDGRAFVYLHRLIAGALSGTVVDHIDADPLNCQRENLQIITQSRNLMRCRAKFGGVTLETKTGRWRARMRVDGKQRNLGMFDTYGEAQQRVEQERAAVWANTADRL